MTRPALLSARQLHVCIGSRVICRDLSLQVSAGQTWGILGINGIGKTTLLHTLAGLRAAQRGNICFDGQPLDSLSRRNLARYRGVLFQDKADPFPATVLESVLIGRHPYIENWQWETARDRDLARQALRQVDLAHLENRTINTLSGGERQRVAIATLLAQDPKVFLLDEPANHLDIHHQMEIMQLLARRARQPDTAVVMILHDINSAARFCDHILMLFEEGETLHGTAAELLNVARLEMLYGHPVRELTDQPHKIFIPV